MSHLKAPNGKPSNLTPEQWKLVRTPQFKAWFGDWENDPENASKVVDENGEPLVVYHRSKKSFYLFDIEKQLNGWLGKGFYFSESKDEFKTYGNKLLSVFLNIKNPFKVKGESPTDFLYELKSVIDIDENNTTQTLKNNYYDGVIYKHWDYIGRMFTCFDSNQIKLTDGSNTTFDGNNPDIRFAEGGKTKRYMKKIKRGGITYGKSHAEGGIPVKNQSTGDMLEVEGGEGIVNKRSMASKSKVKLNGKDMSICEAVSQLNQMEGGVQFSCEDVSDRQFIKAMAKGGELDRGTRTEKEHIQVLKDLYEKRITPKQASERIAKDHLKEDSQYYSKLARMEGKMAKGGKVKNDYNVLSTEDLVDMVANAREKQIKKVKQSGVPIVIGRNDGYYFKTSDSPNYSEEILSSRPSKRKVIEIIESNPNVTEVYFQGSIRGGDYIGDVDFDIIDDFAVLLWKKPIDVNNAIGTTFQWTDTDQDPKNEDKQIPIDPRVYMIVKQSDAHIYKDRPTDDKYFYLNSYFEKNGEQSAIRIPKSDFHNLIEEGALETIEVSQGLKEKLLTPMKTYAKGGEMADGGKTRKNAKKTLTEVVGFDIDSIDISKL